MNIFIIKTSSLRLRGHFFYPKTKKHVPSTRLQKSKLEISKKTDTFDKFRNFLNISRVSISHNLGFLGKFLKFGRAVSMKKLELLNSLNFSKIYFSHVQCRGLNPRCLPLCKLIGSKVEGREIETFQTNSDLTWAGQIRFHYYSFRENYLFIKRSKLLTPTIRYIL